MINKMDKYSIITLKKKGHSFRYIAKQLNVDRKTVSKIWHQYSSARDSLISSKEEITVSVNLKVVHYSVEINRKVAHYFLILKAYVIILLGGTKG